MKSIQLINPQHASELLEPYKYSFIQVLTTDKPIVLANANSFSAEQVQGLQIEININSDSAYKIDLANYAEDITLELRDLEWGILFLINNTEHLLRVNTSATEKDYVQVDKFPELQIIDFGSGQNEHLTNINLLSAFKNLNTLNLSRCTTLIDLSPLAGLMNITTLNLHGCESLNDLSPLVGLTNLSTLDLGYCRSLNDLSPLTDLTNLTTLDLGYCKSLSDLTPLAGLTNLRTLDLSFFESLNDLSPLAGLTNLRTLDLGYCRSLTDLPPLAGLTNITTLNLHGCESLNDLSPLVGLTNLSTLDLGNCRSLNDMSPLTGLTNLTTLNLRSLRILIDVSPLAGLTNLTTLNLRYCRSLNDLSPLAGLTNLSTLDLGYCRSLTDLPPLAGLTNITTLNLNGCESLTDLPPLAGLTNLSTLDLSYCESLTDLSLLAGLTNLSTLDLSSCESLTDLSLLAGLTNITTLNLNGCESLNDLSPLAGLTNLSTLDLSSCESLTDLSLLAGLTNLSALDLSGCKSLIFVKHLAKLKNLIDLNLEGTGNVRDFEELIHCPVLKKVQWIEEPICSYVLAGSVTKRKDSAFIKKNIEDWLSDIKFSKDPNAYSKLLIEAIQLLPSKQDSAKNLIKSSIEIRNRGLADGEKGNAITAYIWELWADAALQLGAEHFNHCFETALANLNTEGEIEVLLSPILTALADVPIQYPSAKTWALSLVNQTLMPISEQEDAARIAAPAAAVFYAGMQMPEEVMLWLKRGTHPSIPRWKDTVFLALVNYYATKNIFIKARDYTSQIELPDVKDQARILLAEAMAGTMPNEALEELANISDLLQQIALAKKLMLEPKLTSNTKGIYQLLLCLEQSPTDLGDFIQTLLSQNPESKLVKTIEGLFAKEAQVTSVSATALLTICTNPSITDFISNRVLERLKQELQEIAANERLYLNKELTAQLIEKNLLPAADEKDFLEALNN